MNLKKKILLAVCVIAFFLLFPQKIYAMDYEIKSVFYYTFDDNGMGSLQSEEIGFCGRFSEEQKAFVLFSMLFESNDGKIPCIPTNTTLIDTFILSETLIIDVSSDILQYGGTANEKILVNQILKTAATLSGIVSVTLWVDGRLCILPEGTEINNYILYLTIGSVDTSQT